MERQAQAQPREAEHALARIAAALERLAPADPPPVDWLAAPAYVWDGHSGRPVPRIDAPALDLLKGIERQKDAVTANVARLAAGHAAHDMLLWGARGTGKSALLRAAVASAQAQGGAIALVQVSGAGSEAMPALFASLAPVTRNFLVFLDDLGFASDEGAQWRRLRSWLDGGVEARPGNIRLAVTANRRAIIGREAQEQSDPLNPRDAIDDALALADRFGLSLGFHAASQDDYLAMVAGYAARHALPFDRAEAIAWAARRGGRSGRVAWQYVTELAGRAGRRLD